MGAPKEVWVVCTKAGTPTVVSDSKRYAEETAAVKGWSGGVERYVLARPKREAVAWVVAAPHGGNYANGRTVYWSCTYGWVDVVALAQRFQSRFDAEAWLNESGKDRFNIDVCRVVKIVRPVKP